MMTNTKKYEIEKKKEKNLSNQLRDFFQPDDVQRFSRVRPNGVRACVCTEEKGARRSVCIRRVAQRPKPVTTATATVGAARCEQYNDPEEYKPKKNRAKNKLFTDEHQRPKCQKGRENTDGKMQDEMKDTS